MGNLDEYYKILELEPGASQEEIHQGYRDLALVWHPDRFPNHPRLKEKAEKKLQLINEAHQQLKSHPPTSVSVAYSSNSEAVQKQTSYYPNSNDFYRQPKNQPKTENYNRTPPRHFNWKDIYVWLD